MSIELNCEHGATVELDGVRYMVEIEPDGDSSLNDYDSDGRYEWIDTRGHRSADRPDSMNGSAMKLSVMGGMVWWQPMEGYWHTLTADQQRAERSRIADLISFGYVGVMVHRQERCDKGHWHTVDTAGLWGLEWDVADTEYGREVLQELLAELTPVGAS